MSEYELKIVGGTIIDGTGQPRYAGDVAVSGGRIVAVGDAPGSADRVIDAQGALVTPGFVDIHTHYDGQISWDGALAPSIWHGVTTAVVGSCGVGFAPVRPKDHERLIELMEGVEDIPGAALAEGIQWGWESFPEYLETIDSTPHTMDLGAQVPHDALRVYVMGERAVADEPATEADIAEMRRLMGEALDAGAVGFSTGRSDVHRSASGQPTPASEASARELMGIAEAFRGRDHGVLQAVSDFDYAEGPGRFDGEFDLLEGMLEASGRPLSLSLMQRIQAPTQWKRIIARAEAAAGRGLPIRLQVAPRGIGVMLGLDATFHPFIGFPSYVRIAQLPLAERVRRMRDPEFKARMLQETSGRMAGDGSSIPPLADELLANIDRIAAQIFRLGQDVDYEQPLSASLAAEAQQRGRPVLEVLYDALLEDEGRSLLYFPIYNYLGHSLDVVREMLAHPLALPGLSDAGAHVGTVCDASFPTYLLTHWGRDRASGRFPLERLVQMQAHDTARYIGLPDRGTIAVGQRADLNVIELERLRLVHPEMVRDLPAGGRRLLQRAEGYVATLVNGQVVVEQGRLTGARPGRVVRPGAAVAASA